MPDLDAPQGYLEIQIILIILTKQVNLCNTVLLQTRRGHDLHDNFYFIKQTHLGEAEF